MTFTKTTYKLLKRAYEKAMTDNEDSFIFGGQEFDTNYAKYLLEYLKDKLCV